MTIFLNLIKIWDMLKWYLHVFIFSASIQLTFGENFSDTVAIKNKNFEYQLNYKKIIVPTSLIAYGAVGTYTDPFKRWNVKIRNSVTDNIHKKYSIDDQLRYVPIVSVYLLDVVGVKAKHRFIDRSIIMLTSYLLTTTTVRTLKGTTCIMRPDSSLRTSFPSGHTSLAFAGAEFLWQEYKDRSVWYGIAGYTIAGSVGVLRIVNNKHWLTDVIAGAGVGMLCTKTSYFLYERVRNKVQMRKYGAMLFPIYNYNQWGIGLSVRF
jgi:hypothetical protein